MIWSSDHPFEELLHSFIIFLKFHKTSCIYSLLYYHLKIFLMSRESKSSLRHQLNALKGLVLNLIFPYSTIEVNDQIVSCIKLLRTFWNHILFTKTLSNFASFSISTKSSEWSIKQLDFHQVIIFDEWIETCRITLLVITINLSEEFLTQLKSLTKHNASSSDKFMISFNSCHRTLFSFDFRGYIHWLH